MMDEFSRHFEDMEMDVRVEEAGVELADVATDHLEAVRRDLATPQGRELLALLAGPLPTVERF